MATATEVAEGAAAGGDASHEAYVTVKDPPAALHETASHPSP
jgi:hypothetical protein